MNKQLLVSVFSSVFITTGFYAQTKSKTFKEIFNTGENTVVNINTSNTDIAFETWGKNQVEISAIIELEGVTNEEAERYFKNNFIEIKGNSKEIDITTELSNKNHHHPFRVDPDITFKLESIFEDLNLLEIEELSKIAELKIIPEIPPLPEMPIVIFDYKAYKKDGKKYFKKWKKHFDENFDAEFKKDFEEWGVKFKELNEERLAKLKKRNEKLVGKLQKRDSLSIVRDKLRLIKDSLHFFLRDSLRGLKPNIFYLSSDNKKYKIKKSIKIKMPKSVKLKMNVRHGEVKLAATTKDLNASLQYASLLASTIDGKATDIKVSYSPVSVQKWNYGQLKTNYSEQVHLKEVGELSLNAVSSNVIIDKLNKSVLVTNNLGAVEINAISTNFKDIDVTIQNGELICKTPKTPISFYFNDKKSTIKYPSSWIIEQTKNYDNIRYKGFQTKDNSGKSIRINSKYSEITLKN